MFALRYVALAALVVWLGGMVVLLLAGADALGVARLVYRIALVCGSVLLIALSAIKLLGPPPRAFSVRALVAAAMLVIAAAAGFGALQPFARALTAVNVIGGLFLLSFYVKE